MSALHALLIALVATAGRQNCQARLRCRLHNRNDVVGVLADLKRSKVPRIAV